MVWIQTWQSDHKFLASSYHTGIIAGFTLISSYLQSMVSNGKTVEAVVIGLGAGLLPMFLHKFMPFCLVQVVKLDPEVLRLARDYFSFQEDGSLKVHLADGIVFIQNSRESAPAAVKVEDNCREKKPICDLGTSSGASPVSSEAGGQSKRDIDLIIVDVDSSDSRFLDNFILSNLRRMSMKLFLLSSLTQTPKMNTSPKLWLNSRGY